MFGRMREPHVVEELTSAQRLHLNAWTGVAGIVGLLVGVRVAQTGVSPLIAIPGSTLGLVLFVRAVMWLILNGTAGLVRQFYDPSGRHTPSRPAYSGPESLAARGRFEDAIVAYQAVAAEEAADPEPWLRIARIERADLGRPRRAVEAYRAARARVAPDSPAAMLAAREIAELYLGALHEPARAMPELARLASTFPHTPTGAWAALQLAELRARALAGEFDQWVKEPLGHRPGPRVPAPEPPDSPPAPDAPPTPEVPIPAPSRPQPTPEVPQPEGPTPEVPVGPEGPGAPPVPPGPDGPVPRPR